MGRPRKFDTDTALTAIRDQFWNHGYSGTSIDALLKVTRLGKGSFYGAFGDKRALFLTVLKAYAAERSAALRELHQGTPRAIDALRGMLLPEIAPRGCFLVNSTIELGPKDAEIMALAREAFAGFEAIFTETARRAIAEGDLPASTRPRELGATVLAIMGGQELLSRTGMSKAGLELVARNAAAELLGMDGKARTRSRRAHHPKVRNAIAR